MTADQKPGESDLERFERLADEFHRSTGMMAPGKDSPLSDPGEHTWQERSTAWTWWCRGYGCAERNAGEGWVACSDRLPDAGYYLVIGGCFIHAQTKFYDARLEAWTHSIGGGRTDIIEGQPTHWRPLIEPPTTAARREESDG